jgi:uncharacterized cupin superfamily protein
MNMKRPALDPSTITPRIGSGYPAEFAASTASRSKRALMAALWLSQFGVNITELPTGTASALKHWHSHEDEFVYILSGEVVLVTDNGEQTLTAGMCAGFPAGVEQGHFIENRSDVTAVILEVGTRDDRDTGNYPDDDLYCPAGRYQAPRFTRKDGTAL